jgi:histidinol-phosphatase
MLVARGSAEAMIEPQLRTWDWAAVKVIVEEAGGQMTQLDGGAVEDRMSVLSTNGLLHDEIVSRFVARSG